MTTYTARSSEMVDAFKGLVLFIIILAFIMAPFFLGTGNNINDTLSGDAPLFSCVEYDEMFMTCRLGG